jgi:AcrR family transcriptional regulator
MPIFIKAVGRSGNLTLIVRRGRRCHDDEGAFSPIARTQEAMGGPTESHSRQRILNAATQVADRDGIAALTLDAVAREASMSKGGLIHHFGTKNDLILAMLEHFRQQTLWALEARIAQDENPRGRSFRAMVDMVLPPLEPGQGQGDGTASSGMCRFFTALLAASANSPGLLDAFRHSMESMREALLAEGANGVRQVALWPAIHGLLLWQHLGVISAADPIFQVMVDELLSLAEGPRMSEAVA